MRRGNAQAHGGSQRPAVPPSNNAQREFCQAIEAALTLAAPATTKDELTYLRISRDRARVVLFGCKTVLTDHQLDDRDLMAIAASPAGHDHPTPCRPVHAQLADLVMSAR